MALIRTCVGNIRKDDLVFALWHLLELVLETLEKTSLGVRSVALIRTCVGNIKKVVLFIAILDIGVKGISYFINLYLHCLKLLLSDVLQ